MKTIHVGFAVLLALFLLPFCVLRAAPGNLDPSFSANITAGSSSNPGQVKAIALQPDGKIIIVGYFTHVDDVARNLIARLNADGTLDAGFVPGTVANPGADNGAVTAVAVMPDGKILVGGTFTQFAGQTHFYTVILNLDGSLASDTFYANNTVRGFAVQPDGKVLVGGSFDIVSGATQPHIARLNADLTYDNTFVSPFGYGNHVAGVTVDSQGRVYITSQGSFNFDGGITRAGIARLTASGGLDASFDAGFVAGTPVYCVGIDRDDRPIISYEESGPDPYARLNIDGSFDSGFTPFSANSAYALALQADGKTLVTEGFGVVPIFPGIARLGSNGTAEGPPAFDIGTGANSSAYAVAVQADGKILLGGEFSEYAGTPRFSLVRLMNDPVTESLTVDGTTRVEWLRGGPAPEVAGVGFELSTDGGSVWSPLGAGTRIAGGWELTGLSLPGSGKIRARAVVSVGGYGDFFGNGSGLVESIAVFPAPVALPDPTFDSIVSAAFGESWTFTATQTSNAAGLSVRVQSTLTPDVEGSWTDLPGGGLMARAGDTWTLSTAAIPQGLRVFRVICAAPGFIDSKAVYEEGGDVVAFNISAPAGRIVYVNADTHQLAIMNADGGDQAVLTSGAVVIGAALSADSSRIAFTGSVGGNNGLYVMDATVAGANNVPVLVASDVSLDSIPSWSPDGRRLAFGRTDAQFYPNVFVITAVNASGAITPEHATNNPSVQVSNFQFSTNTDPAWNPDGRTLAFTRETSIVALRVVDATNTVTPESGSNTATTLTLYSPSAPVQAKQAAWNADGTKIVFACQHQNPSNFQVTGTSLAMLTVRNGAGAFTAEHATNNPRVQLTNLAADPKVSDPTWSADSALIAFVAGPTALPDDNIFVLHPEAESGSNMRVALTTTVGGGGSAPSFSAAVLPLPSVPAATNLVINPAAFGEDWTFRVTQPTAGVTLRVQSSLNPNDPDSWQDLDEMTDLGGGEWELVTADLPLGDRYFRVVSSADGFEPHYLVSAGFYPISLPAGRIVYTKLNAGTQDLMIMEADGSAKTRLTDGTVSVNRPSLSADSAKVAFSTSGALYVMKAQRMGASNVPVNVIGNTGASINTSSNIAWSPDGQHVAFANSSGKIYVIEAVDSDGNINTPEEASSTLVEVITANPSGGVVTLAWSPDGRVLAYTSDDAIYGLSIMDEFGAITPSDGENQPDLLTTPGPAPAGTYEPISPAWSPDAMHLAFIELHRSGVTEACIFTRQVRDENGERLPESGLNPRVPLQEFTTSPFTRTVSWSADGTLLALGTENGSVSTIEVIAPAPIDAGTNPRVPLTTFATDGNAFVPSFRQPVGDLVGLQTVAFEFSTYAGNEDGIAIPVRVIRSGGGTSQMTVDYSVSGGTAVQGIDPDDIEGDFALAEGPMVFASGETEKTIFVIPINDGEVAEGDETVELTLDTPDIGEVGSPATTTITIHDNESNAQPFAPPGSELKVLVDRKAKKKGKFRYGGVWSFLARQQEGVQLPGLQLRVEFSATPDVENSWQEITEPIMGRSTPTSLTWVADTRRVPTGTVWFRTRTYADARRGNGGPRVGPFTIDPAPLLEISATPRAGFTRPGEFILYDVVWRNSGNAPATNVVVNIKRPRLTTFDTATNLTGTIEDASSLSTATKQIFYIVGTLAAGQQQTETIHFRVDPTVDAGDSIRNYQMTIGAKPPTRGAAIEEITTPVLDALEIIVGKDVNIASAGGLITYTLTAYNRANFAVSGATVTNQVPAGTFIHSILDDNGSGNFVGAPLPLDSLTATTNPGVTPYEFSTLRVITWRLGNMPANSQRQIIYTVRMQFDVPAAGFDSSGNLRTSEIRNGVFSFSAAPPAGGVIQAFPGRRDSDPGAVPGEFVARTLVSEEGALPKPSLTLQKSAQADGSVRRPVAQRKGGPAVPVVMPTVLPGNTIDYEIRFENKGDSPARNTIIFDAVPEDTAFTGFIALNGSEIGYNQFVFYDAKGNKLPRPGRTIADDILKVRTIEWHVGDIAAHSVNKLTYRVSAHDPVTLKPTSEFEGNAKLKVPKTIISQDYYIISESLNVVAFGSPRQTLVQVVEPLKIEASMRPTPRVQPGETASYTTTYYNNSESLAASNVTITQAVRAGFIYTGAASSGNFPVRLFDRKGHEIIEPATTDAVRERVASVQFVVGMLGGFTQADFENPVPQGDVTVLAKLPPLNDPKFPNELVNTSAAPPNPEVNWNYTRPGAPQALLGRGRFVGRPRAETQSSGLLVGATELQKVVLPAAPQLWSLLKSPLSAPSGSTMTYSIVVGNQGKVAAENVEVAMIVPAGTVFNSADNDGKVTKGTVRWKLGTMAPASERGISFSVRVTVETGTVYDNSCVVVSSNAPGVVPGPCLTTVIRTKPEPIQETIWNGILSLFGCGPRAAALPRVRESMKRLNVNGNSFTVGAADFITSTADWIVIPQGPGSDRVVAVGAAGIVAGGGGNIVAGGGGNIVAGGGGNVFVNGVALTGSTLMQMYDQIKANQIVAAGGGNLIAGSNNLLGGKASIVAAGGGNVLSHNGNAFINNATGLAAGLVTESKPAIVAAGGGNIVAGGGGNIVAAGGGNIVAAGGGNARPPLGATIVAAGGGNIVAAGGGNIALKGNAIVAGGGGNIVAGGGGNIVAAGGGNIVAAGGGNIVAGGGGNIVAGGGGNIVAGGGGN